MSNKVLCFWLVLNIIVVVMAVVGWSSWMSAAIYFAIGDFGYLITEYLKNRKEKQ